jgi:NDP-mannose synthase
MQAVILAGGKGTRLYPFTANIPKSLVPVGEIPILEIVLKQLKYYGFTDIVITVNHLANVIMDFFKNGDKLGLNITYSSEETPLGTAGPLSLIDSLEENFLVMNGDLLTTINYQNMFDYHKNNNSDATIGVYKKEVKVDLGVLEMDNDKFKKYIEKPKYSFDVSMGIYIFNRNVLRKIAYNKNLDMPQLLTKLHNSNYKILCYKGEYYWLDIGRINDYEEANKIFNKRKKEFLLDG